MARDSIQQRTAIKRILVVDDSRLFANALVKLLTLLGWNAHSAYSAEEARDYLQTETVDLIMLDMGLPGMSGKDFVRIVREEMGITVPIVALSGQQEEQARGKKAASAFTGYLVKPVDMKELQRSLLALA